MGRISAGLLVLLGVKVGDGEEDADWMAGKLAGLRIFPDDRDRLDRSLADIGGEALVVSQFTLYGDVKKGRRPSFSSAQRGDEARDLYERVIAGLRSRGVKAQGGRFGAKMQVHLVNEGPVTLILDSPLSGGGTL